MGGRGSSSMSGGSDAAFLAKFSPSVQGKIRLVMRMTGLGARDAQRLSSAVNKWSGSAYKAIRSAQQGKSHDPDSIKLAEDLEEFLARAPKWGSKGATYRGVVTSKAQIDQLVKGAEVDMRGSASWSKSKGVASGFSGSGAADVHLLYVCKTQKRGVDIHELSAFATEQEVLVSKDARYRVRRKPRKTGGIWICEVEEP